MKFKLLFGLVCIASSVHGQTLASLAAQVKALQGQVSYLQAQMVTVQKNPALQLGRYVLVSPDPQNGVIGPNITFTGANIHIVSGQGYTSDGVDGGNLATGRGNLIIGYDEIDPNFLYPGDRGGSHNLIMGRHNKFTNRSFGCLITGDQNIVSGMEDMVIGGALNTITANSSTSISGTYNTISGGYNNVIEGGSGNVVPNAQSVVMLAGVGNTANPAQYSLSLGSVNGIIVNLSSVQ